MQLSTDLENELDDWVSKSEISEFEQGNLDLEIKLSPDDFSYYRVYDNDIYVATPNFEMDHSSGDLEHNYLVDPSNESEIVDELNNAQDVSIYDANIDWDEVL